MNKNNYHTHTTRCYHASGKDEEYVKAAIKAGIKELGFSDHTPWHYDSSFKATMRMPEYQLDDNIESIRYLKEKYKNPQANIKAEIDLMLQGEVTKNYPKEIKENLIKEKIRLLYVGITRAKEMLILSASAKNSAQDKRNQNPSMYLNILKNIIDNKGE